MKKYLATALFAAALALPAFAGVHKLPKEKPIATVTFPSNWKVEDNDESVDASSDDDEIYINVEVNDVESIEGAIDESFGYLKKNKVKIDKAAGKKSEGEVNGMKVTDFSWDGTDADGPCKVSLTIVDVADKKGLLFLYWASPEGEKKHQAELTAILKSLKPAK